MSRRGASTPHPWHRLAGGIGLDVRLTPKGGRDAVEGVAMLADGRAVLKARVRAAPQDGEANAALIALIAGWLGIAPRHVAIVAGATSRIKRLRIEGDTAELTTRLERAAGSH